MGVEEEPQRSPRTEPGGRLGINNRKPNRIVILGDQPSGKGELIHCTIQNDR